VSILTDFVLGAERMEQSKNGMRCQARKGIISCRVRLSSRLTARRLLGLIHRYLKAGAILPDGRYETASSGVPQGGPLSPLLSNILLDELDKELEARAHDFVRYADDFVILCGSPRAGHRILESVKKFVEDKLKLLVNESKSQVVALKEATFLGFHILWKKIRWTEKSKKRFKAEIRRITRRTRGFSPLKVIADLQRYVRGAINYYVIGITRFVKPEN
jgi:RNA-directed DNA polymerase